MQILYAPNYYDEAFTSCPIYSSSAAPGAVGELNESMGLCVGLGDYYGVGRTDTFGFVLAEVTRGDGGLSENGASKTIRSAPSITLSASAVATGDGGGGGGWWFVLWIEFFVEWSSRVCGKLYVPPHHVRFDLLIIFVQSLFLIALLPVLTWAWRRVSDVNVPSSMLCVSDD